MATNFNKTHTSVQVHNVSNECILAIQKLQRERGVNVVSKAKTIEWWINEMSPKILNDNRCNGILLFKIPK